MGTNDATMTALCQVAMQGTATVKESDQDRTCFVLSSDQGVQCAVLAPSCLLEPCVGDTVWWVGSVAEGFFIAAVLRRPAAPSSAPTLRLPADATLKSDHGRLRIEAQSLDLSSRTLSLEAGEAGVHIGRLAAVTPSVSWTGKLFKLTADLIESFAERTVQFSRWSQRMVDGPDMVRSRQIDYRAEQLMQLQAQNLIANAENLFKADGEQIHLG